MNHEHSQYELVIVGGGPAGVAAGVYAARKQISTLLITESFGGQSVNSPQIENWIGEKRISGADFSKKLENHLREYAGDSLEIKTGARVENISKLDTGFSFETDNESFEATTGLITAGAHRRKLDIPGSEKFENKGVFYCASCDGPLFGDKDVAVIGGGNAGFEAAAQLLSYANSVTLLQHSDHFKAEDITQENVLKNDKMTAHLNAEARQVDGDMMTESITWEDLETGDMHELAVSGVFVEIGLIPNTDLASDLIDTNDINQIVVDPKNQRASADGLWAAGDCTNGLYHQNNIAAGDAVKAIEDIYLYLRS